MRKKTSNEFGCILTHEQEEFINDGRPRDNALKIFRAKAYGNGGNKDGKNVKRGTGKTLGYGICPEVCKRKGIGCLGSRPENEKCH